MSKIHKASFLILALVVFLLLSILIFAQKIDTKKARLDNNQGQESKTEINQVVVISNKHQEEKYAKNIDKIIKDYRSFIETLNKKIKSEQLGTEDDYSIFAASDVSTITQINKNLKNTLVPAKYKDFHLLLSRSLLKLSSYINTSNPKDLLAGLELFNRVEEQYNKLDIG